MITKEVIERATTHRRHLHMYPEVSGEEVETTRYIREALEAMGLTCWNLKSKTGVVAELGNGEGPTLALRAGSRSSIKGSRRQITRESSFYFPTGRRE